MRRRDFLEMLAVMAGCGGLSASLPRAEAAAAMIYDPPRFGNLSLLHFSDTHAQLQPAYYREASCHIGVGALVNQAPFLVGEYLLEYFQIRPQSLHAHALTHLQFEDVAPIYGKVGGFAYLATLLRQLRQGRPDSLLLDGGDTWQGSALAAWTRGQDVVEVGRHLGVDAMTGDWDFALGADRVTEIVRDELRGRTAFLAQNVVDAASGERVFAPHALYFVGGVAVAVIGQASPHVGRVGGRDFAPGWRFGMDEARLQGEVAVVRGKGARVVVVLSHAGMPADVKLASRVRGIDVILGAHSHDAVPEPLVVPAPGGRTIVANAGAGGKFVGVLDLKLRRDAVASFQYRLLPVFSNLIAPDPDVNALIERLREPYRPALEEVLATTEGLLYRRGNFNGSFDELILEAVRSVKGVEIAMSPGYRWGPTLLSGDDITIERLFEQTAVPSPEIRVEDMSGSEIRALLEDGADRAFNADPYLQTGDDMIRVAGLSYQCEPGAVRGQRIRDLRFRDRPVGADTRYRVGTWGLGRPGRNAEPIWHVVASYLRSVRRVAPIVPSSPTVFGVEANRGFA